MPSPSRRLHWGLRPRWAESPPLAFPPRLLIAGHDGLGDTIATLPLLASIRHASPSTQVTWIAPATLAPLMQAAAVDEFIAIDAPPSATFDPAPYGALIVLRDVGSAAYAGLGNLSSIPIRIGATNGRQRVWCNHMVHVKTLGRPRHEARRNLRLLLPFGVDAALPLPQVAALAALPLPLPRFDGPLPADLPHRGYVVLHPFSAGHAREWPIRHWAALADRLADSGWSVVLTGSAAEGLRLADAWPVARRPPGVVDALGRLDLGQLASLLSRSSMVVASSTGPLHLAASLGVACLGLFVPRKGMDLTRWAPLGARALGLQSAAFCLRRCTAATCTCIANLRPEQIAARIGPASSA